MSRRARRRSEYVEGGRMNRPLSGQNLMWSRVVSLLLTVGVAAYLVTVYVLGIWAPSPSDLLTGIVGMASFTLLLTVPERLAFRRDRDAYAMIRLKTSVPAAQLVRAAIWGGFTGFIVNLQNPPFPHAACYSLGAFLAILLNYPHDMRVWKRMWELYEQDQSAASPVAVAQPAADDGQRG